MIARVSSAAELKRCEMSRLANLATHSATSGDDCMIQPLANSMTWNPRRSLMNSWRSWRSAVSTSGESTSSTSASSSAEIGSRATVSMASSFCSSENSPLIDVNASHIESHRHGEPFDLDFPKGRALAETYVAELAQLQQGQKVHNHLDARAEAGNERAKGESPQRRQSLREGYHRFGDRYGVDRHVIKSDHRHRLFLDAAQVGHRQLGGRDTGQQVGRLNDESIVDTPYPRVSPRGALKERDQGVGQGGVRAQLEQARQQDVALLPTHKFLVGLGAIASGQQAVTLHLQQDGGDQQELREVIHVDTHRLVVQQRDELVDNGGQRHVKHIQFVAANELQQQLNGAAEGRRRHDEGHDATLPDPKSREGRPLECAGAHLFWNPTFGHHAYWQLRGGHQAVGSGTERRGLLLRGGPTRADLADRTSGTARADG